ncbi:hypothetical protein J7337_009129 [Fusarium musae]|uniref:Alpha/beta hydrolase fold-3 domain-containing protein n=1 Tax=Fusarium musae TaxID=1042133 RepID=A0A9P8IP76_9HYPO|nr:hypothetical protein J7337_009129 [Fusarium musae]KAG9500647.1 hypothetical protein J7337_009129 [Fusarium musae]
MGDATIEMPKISHEPTVLENQSHLQTLPVPPNAVTALRRHDEPNIIEALDLNYVQEYSKPPFLGSELPNEADVPAARQWLDNVVMNLPRGPPATAFRQPIEQLKIENVIVTYGGDQSYRVRIYSPISPSQGGRPALILYHGGGFIHGYPEVDEDLAKFFALELDAVIINVDYRLAPENQFPIPLNDCYQSIQWTIDNASNYGVDVKCIAIWGCSAGGNLAAAVALRDAMEHEIPRICHVSLVVPLVCHPRQYSDAMQVKSSSVNMLEHRETGLIGVQLLLDKYAGEECCSDLVSVLNAAVPKNHPPTSTTVGGRDYLRDEGILYSLRLRNNNIDSQLEIIPGMPHGITFPPTTHAARQFYINQVRVLASAYQRASH